MIEEKNLSNELFPNLEKLLTSMETRNQLSRAISKLARPNATNEIGLLINKILAGG